MDVINRTFHGGPDNEAEPTASAPLEAKSPSSCA